MNWSGSVVLITGGTGSFGRRMTRVLLDEYDPAKIIIFSRDELKQHEMQTGEFDDPRLRYFIGDVRDYSRLKRAMRDVDIVIHAAALKQVMACEYNPIEAINTNVMGARNIVDAALDTDVKRVIAIGTDKAVDPINLYGATKLAAEKLVVDSNSYSGAGGPRFAGTRYGNVVGSRGSVVPLFQRQRESGRITVTDPEMTRFWITLDQGVRFVIRCVEEMRGGEVFVPKIPSMNVMDLARAVAPDAEIDVVGIRPGEKLHEMLISKSESRLALDVGEMYIVTPVHSWWTNEHWSGEPVPREFAYTSDGNDRWLTPDELTGMVEASA
jgi:UDP-N-acetylglucosamine 4,6-dehydratase